MIAKVQDLDILAKIIANLKKEGKTVALCHGCFDVMHPGHIKHLQSAKAFADALVVTLTPDRFIDKGPKRPIFTEELRAECLAALDCTDYVSVNYWPTAEETLRLLKPTYFIKGQEFEKLEDPTGKIQRENEVCQEVGIELRFTHEIVYSSTKLINQLYNQLGGSPSSIPDANGYLMRFPDATKEYLQSIKAKYGFQTIVNYLNGLPSYRVLLIGEGIVDEYCYCSAMGRSRKSPVVVYNHQSYEAFAGGTFAVANHLSGICDHIQLLTLLGAQDSRIEFIQDKLGPRVSPKFFLREDGSTVIKKRYVDAYDNRKLFEVNFLNDKAIGGELEEEIVAYIKQAAPQVDLVVISDFGHGLMTEKIKAAASRKAKVVAVSSQSNAANFGYNLITQYRQPNFVCLDEQEARLAVKNRAGPIEEVGRSLRSLLDADCLIVTLGKNGSIGLTKEGEIQYCPIFSSNVVDTVGAGDAFFAFAALCYASGMPLDLTSFIGNVVGALAVQIVCNRRPVERVEVIDCIHNFLR